MRPKKAMRAQLCEMLKQAIDHAETPALRAVSEVLVENAPFRDERDQLLVTMADVGFVSDKFQTEQSKAVTVRNTARDTQTSGIHNRKDAEARAVGTDSEAVVPRAVPQIGTEPRNATEGEIGVELIVGPAPM